MPLLRALGAGVAGLGNFQTAIDIIGNDIANVNTVGFKSSDITFQSAISQLISGVTPPSGTAGGTNPIQIGLGTNIASTNRDFSQGQLQVTGRATDMAVNGNGF